MYSPRWPARRVSRLPAQCARGVCGLSAGPRADPGAFGAGLPLVLPSVIDALAHCSAVVRAFLGEPAVSTTVATASLVVAIRQLRQGRKSEPPVNEAAHVGTPPATPEPAADSPVLDPVLVDRAVAAVAALVARLQRAPATVGSAEATADNVMAELANDPEGATCFLRTLDEADS